ncbi:MAG: TatD family hydrolase [Crocinitomicaceae bacterium]|nr:TatD family hydrolase [Crocinitomicaceae bacterium]
MYFIDTHTHLYSSEFDTDRTEVVEYAIKAGVKTLLLPNIDVASIEPMYSLCAEFPLNCFPMMGLHPGYVNENWENDLAQIKQALFEKKNYAVGEIGMDLYWDKTFIEEQKKAFHIQIEWAKELNLPIVIHAREAFDEIFEILDELNDATLRGVFHCFTGTLEQAHKIQSYGGFYLGIGGVLTYKKSELPTVLAEIPLEQLVLETDAPYLPPTPHRGKRNESQFLLHVAEKVAEVKNCSLMEVARITSENAEKLFQLK